MKPYIIFFLFFIFGNFILNAITFNMHYYGDEWKQYTVIIDVPSKNLKIVEDCEVLVNCEYYEYQNNVDNNSIIFYVTLNKKLPKNYYISINRDGKIVINLINGIGLNLITNNKYRHELNYNRLEGILYNRIVTPPVLPLDENKELLIKEQPEYPGGMEALQRYLEKNIHYPSRSLDNNIKGFVTCKFVVSKTGAVSKVEVIKSLDPDCDKEAVRVISKMPAWKPGKINGRPVDCYFTVSVRFVMQ